MTPYNVKSILNNIEKVFKQNDIYLLSKESYNFLYLMSGFIAHYNHQGFMEYYEDLRILISDINSSHDTHHPEYSKDKDFIKSYGLEYCQSKVDIFKGLKILADKYNKEITQFESDKEKEMELNNAIFYANKHGYKLVKSEN